MPLFIQASNYSHSHFSSFNVVLSHVLSHTRHILSLGLHNLQSVLILSHFADTSFCPAISFLDLRFLEIMGVNTVIIEDIIMRDIVSSMRENARSNERFLRGIEVLR